MQQPPRGSAPPPPPPPPPPGPHGGVYGAMPPPPPPPEHDRPKDGIPYIGSRISLISKTDIRYEGYLFNIDTRQSMVALQHVRSFGTEGRRSEHIPPSDQVLPFATFKASEIKDLHVCEAAPPMYGYPPHGHVAPPPPMPPHHHPAHAPPPPPMPSHHVGGMQPPMPPPMPNSGAPAAAAAAAAAPAPAPQRRVPSPKKAASPQKKQQQQPNAAPATGPTLLTPGSMQSAAAAPRPTRPQPSSPRAPESTPIAPSSSSSARSGSAAGGARTIPGMGDHLLKRKERRVPGGADQTSVTSGSDFNFEQGLEGFDKEEEFSKLSLNESKAKGSYQKSSFFDTISCEALDRLEGHHGRLTASEERKLNTETFGAVGLNNRRGYRGGRGGGRGGGQRRSGGGGGHRNGGGRGGGGGGNRNGNWSRGGRRDGNGMMNTSS
ncbi:hypothetical protein P43SY_009237 [Pythium insidiosum]|uniref:DFDF domain-containing protein n=1 Tax=Pythium insidiosum TaxID=114742 RepID=A0AAD5QBN2_PYTIN|nr:hypothetical protein P43SY_009237 [Pythium insidiosum]